MMFFNEIGQPSKRFLDILEIFLKRLPVPRRYKYYVSSASQKVIDYIEFKSYALFKQLPEEISYSNLEGFKEFDYKLPRSASKAGISAFIRAKNEEDKIYACLQSIIDVFDEIIFVDNSSEDATVELVRKFKNDRDPDDKVKIIDYPFSLARFGSENEETPESSVSNFAYYSNYTLSKCTFRYVVKWDADMIFKPNRVSEFRDFTRTINSINGYRVWNIYGQTLYKDSYNDFWLSNREVYYEPRIFSLSYLNQYAKGRFFEVLKSPILNLQFNFSGYLFKREPFLRRCCFPDVAFYEVKFSSNDEFSHWTSSDVAHTLRKRKEIEAFSLLKDGTIDSHSDYTSMKDVEVPFCEYLVS